MGKLLAIWNYLTRRLAEPSTHAAVASLAVLAGVNIDEGVVHDALTATGVAFGVIGIFVKEQAVE